MKKTVFALHPLSLLMGISATIFFTCSSLRHWLFQSTAFDLGIFAQAIYLISQGQTPISSFLNFHILGDHAAFIFYPLALLYKIYPDVRWLFAVQAIALSLGALPTWLLSLQAGLKESLAIAIAVVYLLYPLVFNVNLFDFHPEVIALPALLWAVWAARSDRRLPFCFAVALILSCKAVLSLTVASMGFWLLAFEKKRFYGAIAIVAGIAWFIIATQAIIPHFGPQEVSAVARYDFLGNSVAEILLNLILKPGIVLGQLFALNNLEYLALLLAPILWGLSSSSLTLLIPAIPALGLNLITDYPLQKDLIHQYSLPILPFLLLAVIATLAAGKGWVRHPKKIVLWSLVAFLALAKYGYFGSIYLQSLDTWQAMREGIALIAPSDRVLTAAQIAPHLTHRPILKLAIEEAELDDLSQFDSVLLDTRHPGWSSSSTLVASLVDRLQNAREFCLTYKRDDVLLFKRTSNDINIVGARSKCFD
jgi:uncharacterized membrane protein